MSKQEKIVCAAVRFVLSHVSQGRTIEEIALCVKYDDNFAGDLFQRLSSKIYWSIESYQQGFITNKNRFVDPAEALKITGWGNQLRFKDRKYLLPEDLY